MMCCVSESLSCGKFCEKMPTNQSPVPVSVPVPARRGRPSPSAFAFWRGRRCRRWQMLRGRLLLLLQWLRIGLLLLHARHRIGELPLGWGSRVATAVRKVCFYGGVFGGNGKGGMENGTRGCQPSVGFCTSPDRHSQSGSAIILRSIVVQTKTFCI